MPELASGLPAPGPGAGSGTLPAPSPQAEGTQDRGADAESTLALRVAVHALLWLVVGNAAGLLLATLLLVPRWNGLLAPLTYGRWVPVHLDLQLYGWCALPLVGLLFALFTLRDGRGPRLALAAWSGTLAYGVATWLSGRQGGKPFLDWAGSARWLLVANLVLLWLVLATGWAARLRRGEAQGGELPRFVEAALLLVLAIVPPVLAWASGPAVYPAINPRSGGATGGSLLGSTLAVVAMLWGFPWIVRRREGGGSAADGAVTGPTDGGRTSRWTLAVLVLHGLLFAALDHGDHSNHEAVQIAALATLGIWPPLLARHLRRFRWPRPARPWLAALAAWGGLLVASAFVTFLPGVLERWKFTDVLVAHAHLAMAAMATSFLVPVLASLGGGRHGLARVFARPVPFVLWHGGCALYVVSMTAAGHLEGGDPSLLYSTPPVLVTLLALRWLAGAALLAASASWFGGALVALAAREGRVGAPVTEEAPASHRSGAVDGSLPASEGRRTAGEPRAAGEAVA